MSTISRSACEFALAVACAFLGHAVAAQTVNPPAPENAAGSYKVSGTIVSKTDGRPLGRARVTLRDGKDPRKFEGIITEDDGKFAFEKVPAGKYALTGEKRSYITASYEQHDQFSTAIVTGVGVETEGLLLKLAPNALIWGRVLDEAGEAVRHASVSLYYEDHQQGVDQIRRFEDAQTDDLGAYELTNLPPGTYFLSVHATPWYAVHAPVSGGAKGKAAGAVDRTLDVAYPITYYADATDSESATPIPIKGGERLQVDLHLNPVPALHLLFKVAGDPRHGFTFPRLEQSAFGESTFVQAGGGSMVSPGVIEMSGIPAGQYNIRIQGQGTNLQMNGVDVSKDGEQIDATGGEALGSLDLSARATDNSDLPKGLTVALRSKARMFAGVRTFDEKGHAQMNELPAGRYDIVMWGSRRPYSIARMTAEGAEVAGHSIILSAGGSASVSLTLVAGSVEVEGVVKKAGKGFAGAMVVLVPKNSEGNRDLFRRDQSDQDGTFSLRGVVPGSYFLVAIENGWDLDWSQPAVIAVYAKHGRAIEVRDSGKPLSLTEAIGVQSK